MRVKDAQVINLVASLAKEQVREFCTPDFTESRVLFGDTNNIGGPGDAGLTIVSYLYQSAFIKNQFGYGATAEFLVAA